MTTNPTIAILCDDPTQREHLTTIVAATGTPTNTITTLTHTDGYILTLADTTTLAHTTPTPTTTPLIALTPTTPTTTDYQHALTHHATACWSTTEHLDQLLETLTTLTTNPTHHQHTSITTLAIGSGATTLALLLAHHLAPNHPTLLTDADPHQPHLSYRTALTSLDGNGWHYFTQTPTDHDPTTIIHTLPQRGPLRILGHTTPTPHTIEPTTHHHIHNTFRTTHHIISDHGPTTPTTTTTQLHIVTNTDQHLHEAHHRIAKLNTTTSHLIIREHPHGTWPPADVATTLGYPHYHRWPHDRTLHTHATTGNKTTTELLTHITNHLNAA